MKKIAIVTRKMITGGVERALIAMLKQFDYTQVQVDLYLEFLGGDLFGEIPDEVNCIQIPTVRGKEAIRHPVFAARKLHAKGKLRGKKRPYIEQCYLYSRMLMPVTRQYDIAIAYHAPNTVPVFYVIDSIPANKKILWLHGDLEKNGGETQIARDYHGRYDRVFAVSRYAKDSFVKYHPEKTGQTEVFYNYVDICAIREKAVGGPTFADDYNGTRILSIGRLDTQKGFDMAIDACKKLIDRGYRFRWYVCGEGEDREKLQKMIVQHQLEDVFILLGNQKNPYGYLRDCDLYVQPSRCEGFCTTTNEARILHKPVITTAVSGADEQFEHGVTGWIVPISVQALEDQISYCLDHPEELTAIQNRMAMLSVQTEFEIDRIWS